METLKKLFELIQFGDEPINFELKNLELVDRTCGFECYKWTQKRYETYISSYRYRLECIHNSFVSLDINIRPDRTIELLKKVKTHFKVEELVPFKMAKLNSNIMSLEVNENTRIDFVKTNWIDFCDDDKEIVTEKETITIEIARLFR